MLSRHHLLWAAGILAVFLGLTGLGTRAYGWNISALFHMDTAFGERHDVPSGLVLYEDAGYDGMLYYQIARDLPALFTGGQTSFDSPYRFQRILLPGIVWLFTVGHAGAFPMAFFIVNMLATVGTLVVMLRVTDGKPLHALAAVFTPAMFVGVLYTLTEPLSTFFVAVFLLLWQRSGRTVTLGGILALTLSLFARETTIFLIAPLFLWYLWKRQWRQAFLLLLPLVLLFAWQAFLVTRFGDVPLERSAGALSTIPFHGPVYVLLSLLQGWNINRLSSFGLLLFVLPLCVAVGRDWWHAKWNVDGTAFLLAGLCFAMLMMDAESIWGAITSIGRVVTPVYPVYALYAAQRDTWVERTLSVILITVSLVAAVGIAAAVHPYRVS